MVEEQAIHPAALSPEQLSEQCEIRFLRRSGPGGQHRNKVSTAVVLTHRPTGVTAEANESRSQAENRREASIRLRVNLALAFRMERQVEQVPSPLWRSRMRGGKIEVSTTHEDFPALLAETLDVLTLCDNEPREAGLMLKCTGTQIVKLLKKDTRAFAQVNEKRKKAGLHSLK